MKTSVIKLIVGCKEWDGGNGTVYYQSLQMENGDKINIGKKKKLEIGDELTYEIIDTQQEYNKARSVSPNFSQGGGQSNRSKNYDTQLLIVRQSSLKSAVDCCKNDSCSPKDIIEIAEIFTDWVLKGEVVKEEVKKDLPF